MCYGSWEKNLWSCFFLGFPSAWAERMTFVIGFMKFSASEFSWGHSRIILKWLIPFSAMYFLNSQLNGGPLSHLMVCGNSYVEKIPCNFGITVLAAVECTISTSGNLEYASITTNKYSHAGNGSQKSMHTVFWWWRRHLQRVIWLAISLAT